MFINIIVFTKQSLGAIDESLECNLVSVLWESDGGRGKIS